MSSAKSKTLEPLQNLQSPDLMEERLSRLKAEFPDLFTNEGKLNPAELLRLTGEERREHFDFTWWGKAEAKQKAFTPTTAMLKYDPTRSVNPELAKGNCIIEGENLEVLKLLLFAYRGAVKCIYIDPPYNTGNDFVYSDKFAEGQRAYWEQTGITQDGVKTTTNTRTNGRFHSNWLNMIYPRLLVARQLLRDDGVIFVSIDDNEVANLRKVMDEVFGEECFLGQVIWHNSSRNDDRIAVEHEYVLVYAKNINADDSNWSMERNEAQRLIQIVNGMRKEGKDKAEVEKILNHEIDVLIDEDEERGLRVNSWLSNYRNIDDDWRIYYAVDLSGEGAGPPRSFNGVKVDAPPGRHWMSQDYIDELQIENRIVWRGERAYRKLYIDESKECLKSVVRIPTRNGSEQLKQLLGKDIFDKPKPTRFLRELLRFATAPGDIVLDFFGGSGSLAHALLELQEKDVDARKFIVVQIPETTGDGSEAYLAGYRKISDITIDRVKRAITKRAASFNHSGLGFKVFTLRASAFPRAEFALDPEKSNEQNLLALKSFIDQKEKGLFDTHLPEEMRDEVLLKCGFQLDVELQQITEVMDNTVYLARDSGVESNEAIVCLDTNLSPNTLGWLGQQSQVRIIVLEAALDTSTKWNLTNLVGKMLTTF